MGLVDFTACMSSEELLRLHSGVIDELSDRGIEIYWMYGERIERDS